ncbi:MAG TPA: glycosyltransferase family 4 protein [Thermoanaerobaculia bacterium]|nr:glycosyltransferase family 4 protein [Thermoanaerobaculia bacterium]
MHVAYLHYLMASDTAVHHVRQFADAARALGHRVDVHALNLAESGAPGGGGPSLRRRFREVVKRRFARYLHEPKELMWNLPYRRRERELLRSGAPDVLLVRNGWLKASFVGSAREAGVPLVLEVNSPAAEARLYDRKYAHLPLVAERLEGWKLHRAERVVVVSAALRDYLAARHSVPLEKFVVTPNGADEARFRPDVEPDPLVLERLGNGPIIGFVGSFERWHGIDLLATMAREVASLRPEARFLFVGDGPDRALVNELQSELGDRLLCTGRVPHDRVPGLVAAMTVGVMPESNFYGSPLKVIEWMAAGLALVAPAYGPLCEVVDHGVHGLLFEPREPDSLVACVVRLIDEPELRTELGRRAASRVGRSLTWKHNAHRVLDACRLASMPAER